MRAFRNRMIIQKPDTTVSRDAAGHITETSTSNWDDVSECWCEVMPRSGKEFFRAQKNEANVTHVLRTHYDTNTKQIVPTWRLKFAEQTRYLNVQSAYNTGESNEFIELHCVESI